LKDFVIPALYDTTEVVVTPEDTIDATLKAIEKGLRPAALNMASDFNPGGGVLKGSQAQEECLFRRSNYHFHLNRNTTDYPMAPTQVVYTPKVTIIKDNKYNLMDDFVEVDFIAGAAIRKPKLINGHLSDKDYIFMKKKIFMICETAAYHGHDAVVLGCFGCGCFGNPPSDVAQAFKEILLGPEGQTGFISKPGFPGAFKYVEFAVYGDGKDKNFRTFSEAFSPENLYK
jgi:uncharacterized protein (TIGR02452 family)